MRVGSPEEARGWLCVTKGLRRKTLVPSSLVLQWPDNVTFIWLHLVCGVQRGEGWHPSLVISCASRHLFPVLPGILQEFLGSLTWSGKAEPSEDCAAPAQEGGVWLGTVAWGELEWGQQLQFWFLAREKCWTQK